MDLTHHHANSELGIVHEWRWFGGSLYQMNLLLDTLKKLHLIFHKNYLNLPAELVIFPDDIFESTGSLKHHHSNDPNDYVISD